MQIDYGDTAFIIMCAALVLFMTPGLALFYGGLVRSKNVLSTTMHSFFAIGLISVIWALVGYTIAFGSTDGPLGAFIGGFEHLGLAGVVGAVTGTIPTPVFAMFQGMFADAPIDTATWAAFDRALAAALAGNVDLATRLAERRRHYPARRRGRPRVETGVGGPTAWLRVRAPDRTGLLYDIAAEITAAELRITRATIVSRGGLAYDTFHLTTSDGQPPDELDVLGHLAMRLRERAGA